MFPNKYCDFLITFYSIHVVCNRQSSAIRYESGGAALAQPVVWGWLLRLVVLN